MVATNPWLRKGAIGSTTGFNGTDLAFPPPREVVGKPFLTITADPYGTADFGPWTEGTKTSGWNEALCLGLPIVAMPGTYPLTQEINPTAGVLAVRGMNFGLTPSPGMFVPTQGVILQQNAPNLSVIHSKAPLSVLDLEGLSLYQTQGSNNHALWIEAETYLNANPPQSYQAAVMAQGFHLGNLSVYGTDASHYAYELENIVVGEIGSLYAGAYGGYYHFTGYIPAGAAVRGYGFGDCTMYGVYNFSQFGSPSVDLIVYDATVNTSGASAGMVLINGKGGALLCELGYSLNGHNFIYAPNSGSPYSIGSQFIIVPPIDQGDINTGIGNVPINITSAIEVTPLGTDWASNITFPNNYGITRVSGTLSIEALSGQGANLGTPGSQINIGTGLVGMPQVKLANGGAFITNPSTGSIPTNPPVSGTIYQNANGTNIWIFLPVYATTPGVAGTVTCGMGPTSSANYITIGYKWVSGATTSTVTDYMPVRIPAGWYFVFASSGVSFNAAPVLGE